jgi:hypothetical protein
MTPTQRHAELVYGECLAQKAILGIVFSGVRRVSSSLFFIIRIHLLRDHFGEESETRSSDWRLTVVL